MAHAASTSEMAGWLYKQGNKVTAWQKRYFVLHGAIVTYYEDEASAEAAEESRCRGAFLVRSPRRRAAALRPRPRY